MLGSVRPVGNAAIGERPYLQFSYVEIPSGVPEAAGTVTTAGVMYSCMFSEESAVGLLVEAQHSTEGA
jgi:hypothetical protein